MYIVQTLDSGRRQGGVREREEEIKREGGGVEEEMRETAKREPMIGGVTEEKEIDHKLKAGEQPLASGGTQEWF